MKVSIAGREFKLVTNSHSRHDILTMGQVQSAGLHKLSQAEDETQEDFAFRIVHTAATKGDIYLLLGHLVMPADKQGKDWTPEMARQTAELFAGVVEPADKAAVNRLIGSALVGFFVKVAPLRLLPRSLQEERPRATLSRQGSEDYGDWGEIVREVAGYSHERCLRVIDWPLRELLLAFVQILKREAWSEYKSQRLVWAIQSQFGGKIKPPKLPDILKERPQSRMCAQEKHD